MATPFLSKSLLFLALSLFSMPFSGRLDAGGIDFCMEGTKCQIDGVTYPAIGFGTCLIHDEKCVIALNMAAQMGYRIIDTATFYRNFAPIGVVLKKYGRQNFYLISKVWHDQLTPKKVEKDLAKTLQELKTDYLDAYLIHWPNSLIPIEDTLRAMEKLRRCRKIRHIGLSNVTVNHVKRALEVGVPISWVQVEMNPFFCDFELLKFCKQNAIAMQVWCPLDRGGRVGGDKLLNMIAQHHQKTPQQVALRWIIQHGCIPLPCSRNPEHIRQNMDIDNFTLSAQEMQWIDQRAATGKRRGATVGELGFTDEFGFSYEECWPKSRRY